MQRQQNKKIASLLLCLPLVAISGNTVLRNIDNPAGWRFLFSLAGFLVFTMFSLLIVNEWRKRKLDKE